MIDQTVKFGGANLMIPGSMSWYRTSGMEKIVGIINSEQLIRIFKTFFTPNPEPSSKPFWFIGEEYLFFQQDNDTRRTSGMAKIWLAKNKIKTMLFPSALPRHQAYQVSLGAGEEVILVGTLKTPTE